MKIRKSTILIYITMGILLFPEGIRALIGIQAGTLIKIKAIIIVYLCVMMFLKKQRPSIIFAILMAIYFTIFVSAMMHGSLKELLFEDFAGFAMCFGFEYWLKDNFKKTIKCVYRILATLAVLNLVCILVFPNGIYNNIYDITFSYAQNFKLSYSQNWLFGYKNNQFGYLLPLIGIAFVYTYIEKKKISLSCKIIIVICLLNEIFAQATMASLLEAFYIIAMAMIVINYKKKLSSIVSKLFNIRTIVLFSSIIVFFVVIYTSDNFISNLISGFTVTLGKGADFNGRTIIWVTALNYIMESPLLGYGWIDSEMFARTSGILGGTHAHNYILHILISGGMVCLVEHIILYMVSIKRIARNRGLLSLNVGLIIGIFFLDGLTSVNFYYVLFNSMFIFAYYVTQYSDNNTTSIN